jgi:hypothetical protein
MMQEVLQLLNSQNSTSQFQVGCCVWTVDVRVVYEPAWTCRSSQTTVVGYGASGGAVLRMLVDGVSVQSWPRYVLKG